MKNMVKNKLINKWLLSVIIIVFLIIAFGVYEYIRISPRWDNANSFFPELQQKAPKVLVFVPHPDDELWLSGLILPELVESGVEAHVVYSTEGISTMQGERNKEAVKSCGHLGIPKKNVHFMGFENFKQFDLDSPSGTRSLEIRNAYKDSIESLISRINPQLIICTDFDFNRDHRTLSILFDEKIGEMLHEHKLNPSTIVWKGYCYNTSYYSIDDFYNFNLKSTIKPQDVQNENYEMDTPQFLWNERIRIPVSPSVMTRLTLGNPIYQATKEHVTQHVQKKTLLAVNSDQVYWLRRLDNELYNSIIYVSSGEEKYLCDFKLLHTDNVTYEKRYDVEYNNCTWIPDSNDCLKQIDIKLKSPKNISYINIYDNPSLTDDICKMDIIVNDTAVFHVTNVMKKGDATRIEINDMIVSSITIKLVETTGEFAGINEIEVFSTSLPSLYPRIIKICDGRDSDYNFVYKMFIDDTTKELPLSFYQYPDSQEYIMSVEGKGARMGDNMVRFDEDFKKCSVYVSLRNNPSVYDRIEICKLNEVDNWFFELFCSLDRFRLNISDVYEKNDVVQKIKRYINFYL